MKKSIKKNCILILMIVSVLGLLLVGCGDDKKSSKKESKKVSEDKDKDKDKEKKKKKKSDDEKSDDEESDSAKEDIDDESIDDEEEAAPADTEDIEDIEDTADEPAKEAADVPDPVDVEIEGNTYLEIRYTETEDKVYYDFSDYVVTVLSSWEEVGTDLTSVSDDGMTVSFMVGISEPKKIRTKEVTVDFKELEANKKQFGNTQFDSLEVTDLFRKGEVRGISFGRAYYDYNNTLYVDVFITGSKLMYSSTIEISLE